MCVFASGTGHTVLLVCAGFTRNSLLYSFFHPFFIVSINMFAKQGKYIDSYISQRYSCYSYVTYQGGGKQRGSKWNGQNWRALGELLLPKPYSNVI